MSMPEIRIHPEVFSALQNGAAVVALESAVITSGLPREPLHATSRLRAATGPGQTPGKQWDFDAPINLELGRAMQRTVREHGAVPATIAIIEGDLCIGLDDDELVMLATEKCAAKASVSDVASIMAASGKGGFAGTTVSATLAACGWRHGSANGNSQLGQPGYRAIRILATGGIGGVHRNWQQLPDISADLRQIASTPVCVVCSGAKSILDLPATLQALETLGVPVLGYRTDRFPQFQCIGDESLPLTNRMNDVHEAARICHLHWNVLRISTGVLLANPVPEEFAMNLQELRDAVEQAERSAASRNIAGPQRTPFLLSEIARLTNSRSLDANISLLLNNAKTAAELAIALTHLV